MAESGVFRCDHPNIGHYHKLPVQAVTAPRTKEAISGLGRRGRLGRRLSRPPGGRGTQSQERRTSDRAGAQEGPGAGRQCFWAEVSWLKPRANFRLGERERGTYGHPPRRGRNRLKVSPHGTNRAPGSWRVSIWPPETWRHRSYIPKQPTFEGVRLWVICVLCRDLRYHKEKTKMTAVVSFEARDVSK